MVLDTDPDKSCFEVWLYFHQNKKVEAFKSHDICKSWKQKVNESYDGGFDSRRHPIFIEEASINSERNFKADKKGRPLKGSSEVHLLAKSMFSVMKNKIRAVRNKL